MSTLEQLAREFAARYPTPASHPIGGDGDWDQDCGSLMNRMCLAYGTAPTGDIHSAWTVWKRTPTAGTNPADAPAGAFHYWDIAGPENGHVGLDVRGGGGMVFMATRRVSESLGRSVGFASVAAYTERSGARYVGWGNTYANGDVTAFDNSSTAGGGGTEVVDYAYGLTPEAQGAIQGALSKTHRADGTFYYGGLVDNQFGGLSVKAYQEWLRDNDYIAADYNADGIPGPIYGEGVHDHADAWGYAGSHEGLPGQNVSAALVRWAASLAVPSAPAGTDWKAWQAFLTVHAGYTGKIDGDPGPLTYTALQTWLKAHFAYMGVIDGDPAEFTWAALARAHAAGYPQVVTPPVTPPVVDPPSKRLPLIPARFAGWSLLADCGTSQAGFDFGAFGTAGGHGSILKAGGGNASDSPYVAPEYLAQEARQRLVPNFIDGHYWFNGRKNGLTPRASAEFYAAIIRLQEGDLIGLDVEDETATNTTAYSPAEAREFVERFVELKPGAKFLLYMSSSLARSQDWAWFKANGHGLWAAQWGTNDGFIPDGDPSIGAWGEFALWQFTSEANVPGAATTRTDVSIARPDLVARYGYKAAVIVDPEPEPEPDDRVAVAGVVIGKIGVLFDELATIMIGGPK